LRGDSGISPRTTTAETIINRLTVRRFSCP